MNSTDLSPRTSTIRHGIRRSRAMCATPWPMTGLFTSTGISARRTVRPSRSILQHGRRHARHQLDPDTERRSRMPINRPYSRALISTWQHQQFKYGYFEASIQTPGRRGHPPGLLAAHRRPELDHRDRHPRIRRRGQFPAYQTVHTEAPATRSAAPCSPSTCRRGSTPTPWTGSPTTSPPMSTACRRADRDA